MPRRLKSAGRRASPLMMAWPQGHRTSPHGTKPGMTVKIGCLLIVLLPAMLRPFADTSRNNLQKISENDVEVDEFLVLFLN
jgi:hypothetical protein